MITASLLRGLFPALPNPEAFVAPLTKVCAKYGINTKARLAAFLAQVGHESGGFRYLKENLNYSSDALLRVFPKYFPTRALAESYARKPAKIGSRIYANRMGNGDEASGDGYKFCGRGAIQLTGRQNYERFAAAMEMSLDDAIAYLETPEGACMSAGWFWADNALNALADRGDFVTLTRRINGGTNGLADRQALYAKAKRLLGI